MEGLLRPSNSSIMVVFKHCCVTLQQVLFAGGDLVRYTFWDTQQRDLPLVLEIVRSSVLSGYAQAVFQE